METTFENNFSFHEEAMNRLCRICGTLITDKIFYNVTKNKMLIINGLKSENLEMVENVHPTKYCRKCHLALKNREKDQSYYMSLELMIWGEHSSKEDCIACKTLKS